MANTPREESLRASRLPKAISVAVSVIVVAILVGIYGAMVWYLPGLAWLVGIVVAASVLYELFLKWFWRSAERVQWWRDTVIAAGSLFAAIFPFFLAGAAGAGIWFLYPFQSIGDVPIAKLTLNQIAIDLLGLLMFLITPPVILFFTIRSDLGDEDFYSRGKIALFLFSGAIALYVIYWIDPTGVQQGLHQWRSDFNNWWYSK